MIDHAALAAEYPVQETHEIRLGSPYDDWWVDRLTDTFYRFTQLDEADPLIVYVNYLDSELHSDFDCLSEAVLREFCRLFQIPMAGVSNV